MEFPQFDGGWSYTQREMTELFRHITYPESYSILEFGGGSSSRKIRDYIGSKVKKLSYTLYESDSRFAAELSDIGQVHLYDTEYIESLQLNPGVYDLILVDGPNGEARKFWYSKIRKNVKFGTILLVDDFNHYASFSEELDKNFEYQVLEHHEEPFVEYGEHSWKIVKVIYPKF